MRRLVAYRLQPPALPIVTASQHRRWMDETPDRFAFRCLPILIANQSGWLILNVGRVTATWNGGRYGGDCVIQTEGCPEPPLAHFGSGTVTWRIPFLFRTPPGWNLLVRGPANLPKDGAVSLEGVVETDWAVQPAFHTWKITRVGHPVTWEHEEPICMVLPQRRGELESWEPVYESVFEQEELRAQYVQFSESRTEFNRNHAPSSWQKHYFLGTSPAGARAPAGQHQTKLDLRDFQAREDADIVVSAPLPPMTEP